MAKNTTKAKKEKTYRLTYFEVLQTTIDIEATSAKEAREKAWDSHPDNIDFSSMTLEHNGFKNVHVLKKGE